MNTVANAWNRRTPLHYITGLIVIYGCLFLASAVQASIYHQQNWVPNRYEVICHGPPCILSENAKTTAAQLMAEAARGVRALNLQPPVYWGERRNMGTPGDHITLFEIFSEEEDSIAAASPRCAKGDKSRAGMVIYNGLEQYLDREYAVYYFMAHEIFHLSQYGYPFYSERENECGTYVPGWILEGTATAVGLEAMRKKYPSAVPGKRSEREARQFSGLRRYDIPLPHREKNASGKEEWSGTMIYYYTSSFWRHLADVYHKGSYGFLGRFMQGRPANGNWVGWLKGNLSRVSHEALGMVFGGFLADYAGWGDPGNPGQYFGREKWLEESFGGCETINLNKQEASGQVEVEIKPLAGECIDVRVTGLGKNGLKKGESAAVQIAAVIMQGAPHSEYGLHLGIAALSDKKGFHCAEEVKRKKKQGLGRCLLVPDDGRIRIEGGEFAARVWNVPVQEIKHRQSELLNLYTVSYTPLDVNTEDTKFGGKEPVTVQIYFVLDVAEQKIDDPGTATRRAGKKAAVAHFAEGSDPQTTLPKQDERGMPANSYALPESLRPGMPVAPPGSMGLAVPGRLGQLVVSQEESARVVLFPGRLQSKGKYQPYALSVGETGEFPMSMTANLGGEPAVSTDMGSMAVEEFTDLVFRARYSGTLCRVREMKPNKPCPNPVPVSGRIVKAFAGSRLPGRHMKIERTPGTEMYRKANEAGMATWSTAITRPATPGTGPSAPGPSTGIGGPIGDCACTCEEHEATNQTAQEMKQREAAGEELEAGSVMGLMRCASTCQREYMICEMEKNRREKEARETRPESTTEEDCDCSCVALRNLESDTAGLLGQLQSGDQSAMDEMNRLGQCMSVCQDSLMRCMRSR